MRKIFSLFLIAFCGCAANLHANSCSPCDDPCPPCPEFVPPPPPRTCAYNAPDCIDLLCQWDIFLTGSFLWLQAKQENMSLGTAVARQYSADALNLPFYIQRGVFDFDYDYKPGFKVGLGVHFDCDNWDIYGQYTYFRSKVNGSIPQVIQDITIPNESGPATRILTRILPDWYSFDTGEVFTEANGFWDLSVDIADLELARRYYVGRCLLFRTFAGLRGLFIRQEVEVTYKLDNDNEVPATTNDYQKKARLKSWAVGPRFGVDTDWNLCGGFRIFANPSASILFTRYTDTTQNGTFKTTLGGIVNGNFTDKTLYDTKPSYLRPQAEITMGLGWSDYFCWNRWFFDLAVGYTFNVFWDQNIFLQTDMPDVLSTADQEFLLPTSVKGGNLYLHGLVVTLKMEF